MPLEISIPFQIVLLLAVPILAALLVVRRWATPGADHLRVFVGGAAAFLAAQAVLLAISQIPGLVGKVDIPAQWQLPVTAVVYGLGIGFFEETARFAVLRLWLKDVRSWADGLLLGIGHGGAESIFTGLMAATWFMTMNSLRSGPPPGQEITEAEQANLDQMVATYWGVSWHAPVLAAVQQILLLVLSVGLASLVMRVFLTGQMVYLLAAIGLHSLAGGAMIFSSQFGAVYSLGVTALAACIGLVIARHFSPGQASGPGTPPLAARPKAVPEPPPKKTRRKRAHK